MWDEGGKKILFRAVFGLFKTSCGTKAVFQREILNYANTKGRIVPPEMEGNGRVLRHFWAFLEENWLKKKRPGPIIGPGL
jgi:hypothetical protein